MSNGENKYFIFVYGTLKTGEPNHFYMTDDFRTGSATLMGTGETINKYPLVVATHNNLPFLLLAEGKGENVEGEIYEIDRPMLHWLDDFESHPEFYRRELAEIRVKDGKLREKGQAAPGSEDVHCGCWVYFLPKYKPEMLELKMLKSYTSQSQDHSPYNTSEEMTTLEDL